VNLSTTINTSTYGKVELEVLDRGGGLLLLISHKPTCFNIFCMISTFSMNAIIFIDPAHFGQHSKLN